VHGQIILIYAHVLIICVWICMVDGSDTCVWICMFELYMYETEITCETFMRPQLNYPFIFGVDEEGGGND
jgi:hypothetical protein